MSSFGVVYVATRHDLFIEEALISADSVKQRWRQCPITLFTDRPEHRLCGLGLFDRVEPIEGVTGLVAGWSAGILNRLKCLANSPFDRTLYLDTDTVVLTTELPSLFELAGHFDVGMAETSIDDSFSRQFFGRPIFNSGVVLYRKNPATARWLEQWVADSERNFRLAGSIPLPPTPELAHVPDPRVRRKLLTNDQISLAALLSPVVNRCGLKVITLDYSWNHRGSKLAGRDRGPIRIRHWPRVSKEAHAENLNAAVENASLQAK